MGGTRLPTPRLTFGRDSLSSRVRLRGWRREGGLTNNKRFPCRKDVICYVCICFPSSTQNPRSMTLVRERGKGRLVIFPPAFYWARLITRRAETAAATNNDTIRKSFDMTHIRFICHQERAMGETKERGRKTLARATKLSISFQSAAKRTHI